VTTFRCCHAEVWKQKAAGLRGRGTVALDEIFALVGRAVLDGDAAAERGDPVDGAIGDRLGVIENPIFNPFNSPPSSDSRSI
jgi:hypothetical protein